MVTFYCTRKLINELRVEAEEAPVTADSCLGNWYVNVVRFNRYKGYLFVNERTLYSFVIMQKGINARTILAAFQRMFVSCLQLEGFDQAAVQRALDGCDAVQFARATDRKVLGNMNDLKFHYDWEIEGPPPAGSSGHFLAAQELARMPQRNLGWKYSIDVLKDILGDVSERPVLGD